MNIACLLCSMVTESVVHFCLATNHLTQGRGFFTIYFIPSLTSVVHSSPQTNHSCNSGATYTVAATNAQKHVTLVMCAKRSSSTKCISTYLKPSTDGKLTTRITGVFQTLTTQASAIVAGLSTSTQTLFLVVLLPKLKSIFQNNNAYGLIVKSLTISSCTQYLPARTKCMLLKTLIKNTLHLKSSKIKLYHLKTLLMD